MVRLNWASALIPAWKYEEREIFMKMILWLDHWKVSGTLSQCPGVKRSTMNLFPSLKKIEAVLFSFPSHHHSCQTNSLKYFQPSLSKTKKSHKYRVSLSSLKYSRDGQTNRILLSLVKIPILSTWRWNNSGVPRLCSCLVTYGWLYF